MKVYRYAGPVCMFGRVVCPRFVAETQAATKAKALSNLGYQYKSTYGLVAGAKVQLDAKYLTF